jgi:hypothetical protein
MLRDENGESTAEGYQEIRGRGTAGWSRVRERKRTL